MIPQEHRREWVTLRPVKYAGRLEACSCCSSIPQLWEIDPVNNFIRRFFTEETFIAARCACGNTGIFAITGRNAFDEYITRERAAEYAARKWNEEQQATPPHGRSQKGNPLTLAES